MAFESRQLLEHSFLALLTSGIDYRGHDIGCYTSGIELDSIGANSADPVR